MKTVNFFKMLLFAITLLAINVGCVHDDEYSIPPTECTDFTNTISISQLKGFYKPGANAQITDDLVLEGYVSSSDETGNIYKTIYIQDARENPTQGLTISVDATDTYTRFPIGSKIFVKLKGMYLGSYGGVIQLGDMTINELGQLEFGRISETKFTNTFFKSCEPVAPIVPYVVTIGNFNDNLIGALVQIDNAQFVKGVLCTTFALDQTTINKTIEDCSGNTVLLRNSGYSTFWNVKIPSGNGTITAILSKYNTDYQLYISSADDTAGMTGTRCNNEEIPDCTPPADNADIKDLKDLYSGGLIQIDQDMNITATVTANDDTGNMYKYVYIEDATGGIRLKLNRTNLYKDPKFQIGAKITVKAKDLYLGNYGGEIQLGAKYQGNIGNIEDSDIEAHVFNNNENSPLAPTKLTLADDAILADNVGRLVTFEDVEFDENSMNLPYAGNSDTNRTVEDCNGNNILVRTSSFASFKATLTPIGKGKITGILSVFNGDYQIWLRTPNEVVMNDPRCQ